MPWLAIGWDKRGIARVYGTHPNKDVAETWVRDEAMAYLKRRPDTGPLSSWTFTVKNTGQVTCR